MRIFILILSFFSAMAYGKNCEQDIGLFYQVSEIRGGKTFISERQIWRKQGSVLYVYPDAGVSDHWLPSYQHNVQLIRYYDAERQGIEYQPGEFRQKTSWEGLAYLSTEDKRRQMKLQAETGNGCQLSQIFESKNGGQLKWNAKQRYVESFKSGNTSWKLVRLIHGQDRIDTEFNKRQKFNTTDFSDIGDNESDPFIRKMINLGFVEHGASGFYDAAGNALEGEHSHHHH